MKLNKMFIAGVLMVSAAVVPAQAVTISHSCDGTSEQYGDVTVVVHPLGATKKADAVVVVTAKSPDGEEIELAYPTRKTLESEPFKFQYTSSKDGGFKLELLEERVRANTRKGRLWIGQWQESMELTCLTYGNHD